MVGLDFRWMFGAWNYFIDAVVHYITGMDVWRHLFIVGVFIVIYVFNVNFFVCVRGL